jgi:hypothetical protein
MAPILPLVLPNVIRSLTLPGSVSSETYFWPHGRPWGEGKLLFLTGSLHGSWIKFLISRHALCPGLQASGSLAPESAGYLRHSSPKALAGPSWLNQFSWIIH